MSIFFRHLCVWSLRRWRIVAACALLTGGLAIGISRQFNVTEVHRSESPVNIPLALPQPQADDWPGNFGNAGMNHCPRERFPRGFATSPEPTWQTRLPGTDSGGTCVWGDLVLTTAIDLDRRTLSLVACRRQDGILAWTTILAENLTLTANSVARANPACDGHFVFVASVQNSRLMIHAVELTGRLAWAREAGPISEADGWVASPMIYDNLVIVFAPSEESSWGLWSGTSHLTALHRLTGEMIYRVSAPPANRASQALLTGAGSEAQIAIPGQQQIAGYLAATGQKQWFVRRLSDRQVYQLASSSETIFAGSGDPNQKLLAIATDGRGDVTDSHLRWQTVMAGSSKIPPVSHRDHLYCLSETGVLTVLEQATGRLAWRKVLSGSFAQPPVFAGEDLMCCSTQGAMFVLETAARGALVHESQLPVEVTGSLAATRRDLIVHDRNGLWLRPWGDELEAPMATSPKRPTKRL